ncbi:MAG: protein kinase [Blastocatellia bacterium]|nr:protein kinase [Blastocatellia bacterium]
MSESQLQPGYRLGGRYIIQAKIGEGGMGSVYRASDEPNLNRPVAIKVINSKMNLLCAKSAKMRLNREKEAYLRIVHPNIVQFIDSGSTEDGDIYIVQEFITGESLEALLRRRPKLPFEDVIWIVNQVGAALEAAHSEGIIHRDLKPSNIMLQNLSGGSRQVKVIDFGIAKVEESYLEGNLTSTGAFIGTAWYASPEQLSNQETDINSDLWSLAVITYEMLCGSSPFRERSLASVVLGHVNGPIPPRHHRPDLPTETEQIILKSLNYKREERYQSISEFCNVLSVSLKEIIQHLDNQPTKKLLDAQPEVDEYKKILISEASTVIEKTRLTDQQQTPTTPSPAENTSKKRLPKVENDKPAKNFDSPKPVKIKSEEKPINDGALHTSLTEVAPTTKTRSKLLNPFSLLLFATALVLAVLGAFFYKPEKEIKDVALTYRLYVDDHRGTPFYSSGREIYRGGDRFKIVISSEQEMHLYIFNETPSGDLNILFPAPHLNKGSSLIATSEIELPNEWYVFDQEVGAERLLFVLSKSSVDTIERLRTTEPAQEKSQKVEMLKQWIEKHQTSIVTEELDDKTILKAKTDPLIARITLQHR